jgi:glycosyltransferase involved in cell wall biosynthesis
MPDSTPRVPSSAGGPTGRDLHYDLDQLVVKGRRLFGWGWIAHRDLSVRALRVVVESSGWRAQLPVTHGFARTDVARAFPQLKDVEASGFVVTGYVPGPPAGRLYLQATFEDGSESLLELKAWVRGGIERQPRQRPLRRVARGLLRRLQGLTFSRLLRQRVGAPALDDTLIAARAAAALREAQVVRMIFDHDMGGGANRYRDRLIAHWRAAGESVVLCTYHLPTLDYRIRLFTGSGETQFEASSYLALEPVVAQTPVAEIVVNSPVSFDDPALLAAWLARMRSAYPKMRLTVTVHDYFAVCPSFVLLDADGRFCGIPGPEACEDCLRRHGEAHVALSPPTRIAPWRDAWGRCLHAADEVRCFSEASRGLLLRAFPGLTRTTLVPHEPDFVPARRPSVDHDAPLVIGVIGTISVQKGASIVVQLVELLERKRPEARVVVLGALHSNCTSRLLRVTGPYARDELVDLVERHRINMFLFPSIWPETFSYVVSEMVALGLPIVAFDLGAPADRLRGYPLARLVGTVSAEAALAAVLGLHDELAERAGLA